MTLCHILPERRGWVNMIHWELYQKSKFDHKNKWYMPKPESVLENETQKFLWDFEIQTDHLISARRPDLVIANKKQWISQIVDLVISADHRVRLKESEKRDKYLNFAWEQEKTMKYESDDDTSCDWCAWYSHQWIATGAGGLGNKRTSGDHPNYNILKIGQNTKSPRDLRRLAVTQTQLEGHQLTLVWKNSQRSKNNTIW